MPRAQPPIVVIAPDSFKGSLAAPAICAAIARGLARVWPDVEIRACPMADGGEGTLDAVLSRGGERLRDGRFASAARRNLPPSARGVYAAVAGVDSQGMAGTAFGLTTRNSPFAAQKCSQSTLR